MQLNCKTYCILLALSISLGVHAESFEVPCGTWLELRATAMEGWHFDHWNDGDTSAVRQVEVTADAHYVAFFAPSCEAYPVLPVVALYDWLLMLDMTTIESWGYYFAEEDVTWYRVRGVPDKPEEGASQDDDPMGTGYYLTLGKSFVGTGDYYAIVDMSSKATGELCTDFMRSEIVNYASAAAPKKTPILEPTIVRPSEAQRILRLNPDSPTTVTVYDVSGHRLRTLSADGVERMSLQAEGVAGCYQVVVQNGEEKHVLRYIVVK